MEILKYLENSRVVSKFRVFAFESFDGGFYIKIESELIDGTVLFIREYSDKTIRNYSYHWQNSQAALVMRWDNSRHYKDIKTFPHHMHIGNKVLPSYSISCQEILEIIEDKILK